MTWWWEFIPWKLPNATNRGLIHYFFFVIKFEKVMEKIIQKYTMSITVLWIAPKNEDMFSQYLKTIIQFSKEVTLVTNNRVKFQRTSLFFHFHLTPLTYMKISTNTYVRAILICQVRSQVGQGSKSLAKINESILWESTDYMKFTTESIKYFIICKLYAK